MQGKISDALVQEQLKQFRRDKVRAVCDFIISSTKSFVKYLNAKPNKKNRSVGRKLRAFEYCSKNVQKYEDRKYRFNNSAK